MAERQHSVSSTASESVVKRKKGRGGFVGPQDSVVRIHGVGESTARLLKREGVKTIGDLARLDASIVAKLREQKIPNIDTLQEKALESLGALGDGAPTMALMQSTHSEFGPRLQSHTSTNSADSAGSGTRSRCTPNSISASEPASRSSSRQDLAFQRSGSGMGPSTMTGQPMKSTKKKKKKKKTTYALDEIKIGGMRHRTSVAIEIQFARASVESGYFVVRWTEAPRAGGSSAHRRPVPSARSYAAFGSTPSTTSTASAASPTSRAGAGAGAGGAHFPSSAQSTEQDAPTPLPGAGMKLGGSAIRGRVGAPRRGSGDTADKPAVKYKSELRVAFKDIASVLVQDRMWEILLKKDLEATIKKELAADADAPPGVEPTKLVPAKPRQSDRHLLIRANFKEAAAAEDKGRRLAEEADMEQRVLIAEDALEAVRRFYGGEYDDGEVSFTLVRRLPKLAFVKIHDSEKLGDGANGQVTRVITVAADPTHELRALKCIEDKKTLKTVVLEDGEGTDKLRGRSGVAESFRQEVEMQRQVQHPNVLRLFSAQFTSSATYLELELANALDLYEWVATRPFSEEEARKPFYALAEGVASMHATGLCHRDIKLENILCEGDRELRHDARLILADFDTARFVGLSQRASTYAGTTAYMAPEVAKLKHQQVPESGSRGGLMAWGGPTFAKRVHYDAFSADVWSLGVVLVLSLLQEFPFQGDDELRVMYYDKRSSNLRKLSRDAQSLVAGMLAMDPSERLSIDQVLGHAWFDAVRDHVATKPLDELRPGCRAEAAAQRAKRGGPLTDEAAEAEANVLGGGSPTVSTRRMRTDDDDEDGEGGEEKRGVAEGKRGEAKAAEGKYQPASDEE